MALFVKMTSVDLLDLFMYNLRVNYSSEELTQLVPWILLLLAAQTAECVLI